VLLAIAAIGLAVFAWQQTREARAQRQTADRMRTVADKGAADAELANRSAEQRRLELLAAAEARGALEQENRNLQLAKEAAEARLTGQGALAARLDREAQAAATLAAARRAEEARLLEAAKREKEAGDLALGRSEQAQRQLDTIGAPAAATTAAANPPSVQPGDTPAPTAAPPTTAETSEPKPVPPPVLPPATSGGEPTEVATAPAPAPSGSSSGPAPAGDYREVYRRGINAKNRRQWKDAASYFRQALQLRGTDTGERISISGFGNIEPYVPHYYLGVALMNLGDCRGALDSWALAEKDGAIQKTNLRDDLEGGKKKCAP
jgi:sec-independent protein translocase protein TatB